MRFTKDNYYEKYLTLNNEVAEMLKNFKDKVNRDHGLYLLSEWDDIRERVNKSD